MIYGANGYTGNLVARLALQRGFHPILAGRNRQKIAPLAAELGLEFRVFPLDNPTAVASALQDVTVVLHCAGPFRYTAHPMVEGCLQTGTHYLDITGEIDVLETLATRDTEAREAGIMLLPGAGFDVVPTDCLAAFLKSRLPSATYLTLAFQSQSNPSHGTATTMVDHIDQGGAIRRNGRLIKVPIGWKTRPINFGYGSIPAMLLPWGDVTTAYHSTGIPNIEIYAALPHGLRQILSASQYFDWLLATASMKEILQRVVDTMPPGPSAPQRIAGQSLIWGEVIDDDGRRATARLKTPESYQLTTLTSMHIVAKVLAGEKPAGFQTPSLAYGPDLIMEIEGVVRAE
ncbi:MAG: saccharopine dehydrogenase NADP-binding domain-containing protein [Chloroflexi bacterium]|nr:saccharopine dehydrogenase NADP-binding domain-containing protein [Chloroflexota bacterium]